MRMKEESLKEFVDFIIQERMQKAFSQVKAGKEPDNEDDVERKYEEAVALQSGHTAMLFLTAVQMLSSSFTD